MKRTRWHTVLFSVLPQTLHQPDFPPTWLSCPWYARSAKHALGRLTLGSPSHTRPLSWGKGRNPHVDRCGVFGDEPGDHLRSLALEEVAVRRIVVVSLAILILYASPAAAQRAACGGHRIRWIGGAPGMAFDRGPRDHRPPTVPEPEEMTDRDRELWDAIVFNAHDEPRANPALMGQMAGLPSTNGARWCSTVRRCRRFGSVFNPPTTATRANGWQSTRTLPGGRGTSAGGRTLDGTARSGSTLARGTRRAGGSMCAKATSTTSATYRRIRWRLRGAFATLIRTV